MGNFNNNKLFIIFSIIFLSLMVVSHMLNRSFVREILINEQLNILKSSSHRIEKWIENKKLSLKSVNSLISNLDHNKDEIIIKDKIVRVTVSIGISFGKGHCEIDDMLEACDSALYVAKENGRNRVEIAL